MRKQHFCFVIMSCFVLLSCKKEAALRESIPAFTERKEISATGLINNEPFAFYFTNSSGWCTGAMDSSFNHSGQRISGFALYERENHADTYWDYNNPGNKTKFVLFTPSYKPLDYSDLFSRIFSLGKKDVGELYGKFNLVIKVNGREYTTNGNQEPSSFTVVKMERQSSDKAWVWFRVECKLYDVLSGEQVSLTNAEIVNEFSCF